MSHTSDSDITGLFDQSSGAVVGPASATDGDIALFNGPTGTILKDSGVKIDPSTKVISISGSDFIDLPNRILIDSGPRDAYNWDSKTFKNSDDNENGRHSTRMSGSWGGAWGAFGTFKTKVASSSEITSTSAGGDEALCSLGIHAPFNMQGSGDSIHFKFCGDNNGSANSGGQYIFVDIDGIKLGDNFPASNYEGWAAEGYVYYDKDNSQIRYKIRYENGRDFFCYTGDTTLTDGESNRTIRLMANNNGSSDIYKRFGTADWEGSNAE